MRKVDLGHGGYAILDEEDRVAEIRFPSPLGIGHRQVFYQPDPVRRPKLIETVPQGPSKQDGIE